MKYIPMTDEQLCSKVDSAISDALDLMDTRLSEDVIPLALYHVLERAVSDWEGWEEFVLNDDYNSFLDYVDSQAKDNYYDSRCK